MKALLLLLLLLPHSAVAKVYMCMDPATGKATFTDKGCAPNVSHEEVRVQATNVDSGSRTAAPAPQRAWVSDRDTRKTGLEYNAMGGPKSPGDPTVAITTDVVEEGS